MPPTEPSTTRSLLPCVVQVGFAGSRSLFDVAEDQVVLRNKLHAQVQSRLIEELKGLRQRFKFSDRHFLCGISQLGGAADVLFAKACREITQDEHEPLEVAQRIFLPEHRDVYLASALEQQFPDCTREEHRKILESSHIVEQRLVSVAPTEVERSVDCNREILDCSDVVICLIREDAPERLGGSVDFFKSACNTGKPILEIRVRREGDSVLFDTKQHSPSIAWKMPQLPAELAGITYVEHIDSDKLPSVVEFAEAVDESVEESATRHSRRFAQAARFIIVCHIVATLLAVMALLLSYNEVWYVETVGASTNGEHVASSVADASHDHGHDWRWKATVIGLLGMEVITMIVGLSVHVWLHRSHPSRHWALSRLLVEIARSAKSICGLHIYPNYLFRVLLPDELSPMLRTLCVLHLRSSPPGRIDEHVRRNYLDERLGKPFPDGQEAYYRHRHNDARKRLKIANGVFLFFALTAIAATGGKIWLKSGGHSAKSSTANMVEHQPQNDFNREAVVKKSDSPLVAGTLSILAVLCPVLAVGAMSWAAAMTYEARMNTFDEMVRRLEAQRERLESVQSDVEFLHHVVDTETLLLSESAQWYSRQRFTGVS